MQIIPTYTDDKEKSDTLYDIYFGYREYEYNMDFFGGGNHFHKADPINIHILDIADGTIERVVREDITRVYRQSS